jgi:type IV pilus assembly protein PilM
VDKTVKVIQKAGLNPVSLETEMISLARSLVPETIKSALVVDMGASATDIAIVRSGQVVLTRSIPTGGTALTRAVSYELGLEENQAEAYKKAYGLDKTKLEGKVVAALSPVLEVVLKEMEKTLEFFMSDKEGGQIGQIVLSGGSALLVEVTNRITEKMNVEVIVGNPFRDVTMKDATKTIPAESYPFYAVACGLAMKETS